MEREPVKLKTFALSCWCLRAFLWRSRLCRGVCLLLHWLPL